MQPLYKTVVEGLDFICLSWYYVRDMWVLRKTSASGVSLRRRISLLATLLVVAFFAICGPLVRTAYADGDASWKGDTLQYDGHDFTSTSDAPTYKGMSTEYQWIDTSQDPNSAYVFYFKDSNAQQATSAQLLIYTYNPPANYTAPSEASTVKISTGDANTGSSSDAASSCNSEYFGGVGWIVCSVSSWISKGVDGMYTLISNFLEVDTISQGNNGVYAMWDMARSVANICFIIVFLVIVYSQLTSVGYSNYNIKDMIPRLVIAAIVVNISFWICALFVDVSNVLGYSIDSLFNGIRDKLNLTVDVNWTDITTLILSGGTATVGTLAFAAAAAGSWAALGFIILGTLVSAGMSLLAAFVILAVRQALIVVLVIIAPLAFVAMVLPSTKGLFHKWRKSLTMLLVFFPIFALLFGGSQLAGIAIINSQYHIPGGGHIEIVLIGLAVQVIPLAVTPMIMQFADGLLGRIAGIANNKQRGIADRARNWTKDNADYHTARKKNKVAADIAAGRNRGLRAHGIGRLGLAMDQGARKRKATVGDIDKSLENRMEVNRQKRIAERSGSYGRTMYETALRSHGDHGKSEDYKKDVEAAGNRHLAAERATDGGLRRAAHRTAVNQAVADNIEERLKSVQEKTAARTVANNAQLTRNVAATTMNKGAAEIYKNEVEGAAEESWQKLKEGRGGTTGYLGAQREAGDHSKKRAADIDAAIKATDQRSYNERVTRGAAGYLQVRELKARTVEDTKHADFQASQIQAEGERAYNRAFEDGVAGSRALRQQNIQIERLKKESGTIQNTLQNRANANWETVSRLDPAAQTLRLREIQSGDAAKLAETEWNTLVENARAQGKDAKGLDASNARVAESMKSLTQNIAAQESAVNVAKATQEKNLMKAYKDSFNGDRKLIERAAGIGGEIAETRVFAAARDSIVNKTVEAVKINKSLTSEMTRAQLHTLLFDGSLPNGTTATIEMQQAAMYALLEDKGNNQDAQEIRDAIAKKGMVQDVDASGNIAYYEAERDSHGHVIYENGKPKANKSASISAEEVDLRRDWQQFFDDAASKTPHKMVTYSGTNKSEARSGTMVDDIRGGWIRDARGGKFSPDKLLNADIDELKTLYSDMVNTDPDSYYNSLSNDQREQINKAFESAILQLQGNPTVNTRIDDRNRGVMNDILAKINPDYATSRDGDHNIYPVGDDKAIIPLHQRTAAIMSSADTFKAPLSEVQPSYYTDRDIDISKTKDVT